MKKSFPLELPDRKPARVLDLIKHDVRKYIKRERRKGLPEGVDFWDFDCRIGVDSDSARVVHVSELNQGIDQASNEGWSNVYIEIFAKPGYRTRKPKESSDSQLFSDSE